MEDIKSIFKIKSRTLIASEYNEFLFTLYLPLIGYKGVFLYQYLTQLFKREIYEINLEKLVEMSTFNFNEFILVKGILESVNLIETYQKDSLNYIIIINAILSPKNFFENEVFKGLYFSKVGEEEAKKIMLSYKIDDDTNGYKDISKSINDNFVIDFDLKYLDVGKDLKLVSTNKTKIKDDFDDTKLLNSIKELSNIYIPSISNDELQQIHNFGVLYGLNEKIMAEITIDSYNPNNEKYHKIDIDNLISRVKSEAITTKSYRKRLKKAEYEKVSGDGDISKKLELYQSMSPVSFLRFRQNGKPLAEADLNIINYLGYDMEFENSIINALLDFTLNKNNEQLPRNYIEKIATTFARNNVRTCLDALKILYGKKIGKTLINNELNEKQKALYNDNSDVKLDDEPIWND